MQMKASLCPTNMASGTFACRLTCFRRLLFSRITRFGFTQVEFHDLGQKELKLQHLRRCEGEHKPCPPLHVARSTFPSALMFVIKDQRVLLDGGNGSIHLSNRWDTAAVD